MFGLKESQGCPAIRSLSGDDESRMPRDEILDRTARAIWTGISEPGDRVAGALVAAVGAAPALQMLSDGWAADRIVEHASDDAPALGAMSITVDELASGIDRWTGRRSPEAALTALQQAVRYGARLVIPGDDDWPTGVDDLGDHAPIALWVRGNLSALAAHRRAIALVGARAATGYGEHVAMEASAGLVDRGYAITSGAAYGIDGMAHRAALASSGTTVAFVAGGVDRFYPSGHDALLTRIVESGAVVSELPPGSSPTKWRFLQRKIQP